VENVPLSQQIGRSELTIINRFPFLYKINFLRFSFMNPQEKFVKKCTLINPYKYSLVQQVNNTNPISSLTLKIIQLGQHNITEVSSYPIKIVVWFAMS
jgi:hypothetical protein